MSGDHGPWPIAVLVWEYRRLSLSEESAVRAAFGSAWDAYEGG